MRGYFASCVVSLIFFPSPEEARKNTSNANCVRIIILFSDSSHPFDNSQFFGVPYNRVFSRNFQFENLA